jgi:hypothetical protein
MIVHASVSFNFLFFLTSLHFSCHRHLSCLVMDISLTRSGCSVIIYFVSLIHIFVWCCFWVCCFEDPFRDTKRDKDLQEIFQISKHNLSTKKMKFIFSSYAFYAVMHLRDFRSWNWLSCWGWEWLAMDSLMSSCCFQKGCSFSPSFIPGEISSAVVL